jgi:hypothetical protein
LGYGTSRKRICHLAGKLDHTFAHIGCRASEMLQHCSILRKSIQLITHCRRHRRFDLLERFTNLIFGVLVARLLNKHCGDYQNQAVHLVTLFNSQRTINHWQ